MKKTKNNEQINIFTLLDSIIMLSRALFAAAELNISEISPIKK